MAECPGLVDLMARVKSVIITRGIIANLVTQRYTVTHMTTRCSQSRINCFDNSILTFGVVTLFIGCLHGSFQPPDSLHGRTHDYISKTLTMTKSLQFVVEPSFAQSDKGMSVEAVVSITHPSSFYTLCAALLVTRNPILFSLSN